MLYLISLGISVAGLVAACFVKRAELVLLAMGLFYLAEGSYYLYLTMPWGPNQDMSLLDFLLGFCVLGLPLAFLCFSITVLWWSGRTGFRYWQIGQFALCLGFHLLNFAVAMWSPLSEATRFGGAGLALLFGLWNFSGVFFAPSGMEG